MNVHFFDKTPLKSKKFLAFLFSSITSKVLLYFMVASGSSDAVLTAAIFATIFLDVGYVLGQAALDALTRCAQIKNPLAIAEAETKSE